MNAARNATCWGTSDLLGTPFISIEAALSVAEKEKDLDDETEGEEERGSNSDP